MSFKDMFTQKNLPSAKLVLSTVASLAASAMLIRTIVDDFVPTQVHNYISTTFRGISNTLSTQFTIVIEEFDGLSVNQLYQAANIYLGTRTKTTRSTRRIKVSKIEKEKSLVVAMDKDEEVVDVFKGVKLKWRLVCKKAESSSLGFKELHKSLRSEIRTFELSFHMRYKHLVLEEYFSHLLDEFKVIKDSSKAVKLHTADLSCSDFWRSVNLDHPATFDTLAMDSDMKKMLIEDLDRFVKRKELYRKAGRAWKRGYLLYGPPGTGKSSLIAAMANHLNFDIYDLDLTEVNYNSVLRRLLLATSNQSILVLEDIDCNLELENREGKDKDDYESEVTLSGVLNFIDGLWSSCGDERIIVFTTNHKEKLDPALLRPGRMDVHVHMSYCTPEGFRVLAFNYLGFQHHPLFNKIEGLIKEVEATPAEIAGELMKGDDNTEDALQRLITFLNQKKVKHQEFSTKDRKNSDLNNF